MKSQYQHFERAARTIRFDQASEQSLQEVLTALCSRWHLTDKPSLSLLVQGIVRQFALDAKDDPTYLKELAAEINARGGAIGKRNQFVRDGLELGSKEQLDRLKKASN